jgi:alpha-1,2-mannosyltransferase
MNTLSRPNPGLPALRWLLGVLVFIFAVIFVQYTLKLRHSETGTRSAFLRWRAQLSELDDGVNVWDKFAYPNPPIMAIILRPFLDLPPALGASAWFLVKAVCALLAIAVVWRLLDSASQPFPIWGKALAVLLTLRPIEGDLVHGNVNLLVLFLLAATLYAFCKRRDALAGIFLGLSIACKLTPALMLLYFLYKRAWTALLASAMSLLFFVIIVPSLFFGWQSNVAYHRSWYNQMVAPFAAGVVTSEHKNQSLPGVLHRLLSEEASFSDYVGDQKIVLETHNLVSWDPAVVQAIVAGCMVLFVLSSMYFCRASIAERAPLEMLAEFSVVVLGMLLFCERTWKHHCVTLLLPFTVLAYCLATSDSRRLRWYCGFTIVAAALLMLSTSTGVFDHGTEAGSRLGKISQVYGAYVWAFLLLLASMFVILRQRQHKIGDEASS